MRMTGDFPDELRAALRADITSGSVSVCPEQPIAALVSERFPIGLNRIDWSRVPNSESLLPAGSNLEQLELRLPQITAFFDAFCDRAQLSPSDIILVMGDAATDVGFRMTVQTFRNHLIDFLRLPQATYLITQGGEWCFHYTFEDDAYFGPAPDSGGGRDKARKGRLH